VELVARTHYATPYFIDLDALALTAIPVVLTNIVNQNQNAKRWLHLIQGYLMSLLHAKPITIAMKV
jgi:hypothetical protein